jgi:hypothetical protein
MYTQVAEELGLRDDASTEQRLILERALRFYQRFAVPRSSDPAVLFEAAMAGIRLGKIQGWLVQDAQAEASLRDARTNLLRLTASQPKNPYYRDALAEAHSSMGSALAHLSRADDAIAELISAAEIYATLGEVEAVGARSHTGLAFAFSKYLTCEFFIDSSSAMQRKMHALIEREFPALERWGRDHPGDALFQEELDDLRFQRWYRGLTSRDDHQAWSGLSTSD